MKLEDNLWIVREIARNYSWLPVELDDLIQYGSLGLIKAAERFHGDPKGFPSYARNWIRGAILEGIAKELGYFSFPKPVSQAIRDLNNFIEAYKMKNGFLPSEELQREYVTQLVSKDPKKFPKNAVHLILWWSRCSIVSLEITDVGDFDETEEF